MYVAQILCALVAAYNNVAQKIRETVPCKNARSGVRHEKFTQLDYMAMALGLEASVLAT